MKRIATMLWTAGMLTVLVAGVQTLTAAPLETGTRFNPDPDYCVSIDKGTAYYCTYSETDCRICYPWGSGYYCNAVLCE